MSKTFEPAPAQDEREAFEARFQGQLNFERNEWHPDFYAFLPARLAWDAWQEAVKFAATRLAQTDHQPVAWLVIGEPFDGTEGLEAGDWDIEPVANLIDQLTVENSPARIGLYAAPIAQTAPLSPIST